MKRACAHAIAAGYRFYSWGRLPALPRSAALCQIGAMQKPHPRFDFQLKAQDGAARAGEIVTPRGVIRTPAFMPVGTVAAVKALYRSR